MLLLSLGRWKMSLLREGLLLRRRFRGNSIRPTIEARVIVVDDRRVIDDRRIHIGRTNHGRVHSYCRGIVGKGASAPFATGETTASIAESVVDASVVADLRSPIALIEDINSALSPTPVARCPEIARLWGENPGARHPVVVANAVPRPIAGCPHVVGLWTGRLNVNRKSGRLDVDADSN